MAIISKPKTFVAGTVGIAADVNSDFDTIYADYNGNITNANIASGANIVDTKLAQITTGSKVSVTAITGTLPQANGGTGSTTGGTGEISIILDGGGEVLSVDGANSCKAYLFIDFACTITKVTMGGFPSGSVVVDLWNCSYANFDASATHPVAGDKITASAPPTISTATKSQDATLTGWGTSIAAGTWIGFHVTSATTMTNVNLVLTIIRA